MRTLTAPEAERYSRHLLLPEVGAAGQARLLESRVVVVGVGGLGSPCLLYLAAAGVGTLGLVDGDRVERSNLQRQVLHGEAEVGRSKTASGARALARLNPGVRVIEHPERLTASNALDLLGAYDVVVNGCDNFPTRYLVNDACHLLGRPLVDASILRFEAQATVYLPGRGCYRCLFPEPPPAGLAPSCAEAGVLGALAGTVGSLQALETLKILLGLGRPLSDRLLVFDALTCEFRALRRGRDPRCPLCGDQPTIRGLGEEFPGGAASLARRTCGAVDPAEEEPMTIPEIQPEEALTHLQSRPEIQLVDVRDQAEYERYHLPGARHIPLGELERRLGELDAQRPVYTVCARGVRSLKGAEVLLRGGFSSVTSVAAGTEGWKERGLPLESGRSH